MRKKGCYLYVFLWVFLSLQSCSFDRPILFSPEENSSIVIVGNAFAERMQYYNYFETILHDHFREKKLRVRNLGWGGDAISIQTRPLNFPTQNELLHKHKADYIFACFGMNESFDGLDSLASFEVHLTEYLKDLKSQKFNGKSQAEIFLISPISLDLKNNKNKDAGKHMDVLSRYVSVMREVCENIDVSFIDLFTPTRRRGVYETDLTINGIHLNESGYRKIAELLAERLGFEETEWSTDAYHLNLKEIIDLKNEQFFYHYRAVNWEYIDGRRKEPWVQPPGGPISFPSELGELENMILQLDSLIWKQSEKDDLSNLEIAKQIVNDTIQFEPLNREVIVLPSPDEFILPEGFEINLFASEKTFSLHNPVKMTFDSDGRLWVSTMPSYPQYLPGAKPDDKIIILEDTDQNGVADKETIFADQLYLPLSFELGKEGVYVSQPPNMWFMKDTDGDGRADTKEIILHGFGTEDVHHTLSTYTWGPDGALYWHSGTFLHSQIETPYGVQRSDYGATWRYDPVTDQLMPYISYPYANPWGHVFTGDGTEIVSDVSTGMNYFAPPLTVATTYPKKLTEMKDFLTSDRKPKTCGTEIISSRNFPEEMQGNVLFNIFLGTTGINQHEIYEEGSGISAREIEPLLQSKDPNFRPVDIQFGPDGALYVLDWYNPIINHGERALRDPMRDHTHGRIWRITYRDKELLRPIKLSRLSIYELLDLLKEYEDRLHDRVRTQLRQYEANDVIPVLEKWVSDLNVEDEDFERNQLQALWVFQQFNHPDEELLEILLKSKNKKIRVAATRVLLYWKDEIGGVQEKFVKLSEDDDLQVKLQALISLSHFDNDLSLDAFIRAIDFADDYYIDYVLRESFRKLSFLWKQKFRTDAAFLADDMDKALYLISTLSDAEELQVPGFITDDPEWKNYTWDVLSEGGIEAFKNREIVRRLKEVNLDPVEISDDEMGAMLIAKSDCSACHHANEKLNGPAYKQIAEKYRNDPQAVSVLADKIINGSAGVWGEAIMTPHPGLDRKEVEVIVEYILNNY